MPLPVETFVNGEGVDLQYSNAYSGTAPAAGDYQSGTFFSVGGIVNITPNAPSNADIKTTDASQHEHDYEPGRVEPGEITVTVKYTAARAVVLNALIGLKKSWRVLFKDLTGYGVQGYIKMVGPKVDIEGMVTHDVTIKCAGKTIPIYTGT